MKKLFLLTALTFSMLFSSAQFSIKKVLIEEHTGAWCGYCPDGALILDDVLNTYTKAIGISVHNGDAMSNAEGDELSSFYISGYPQGTIDRDGAAYSRNQWMNTTGTLLQGAGLVTVSFDSMDYNTGTREITAVVKALFTGAAMGEFRMNLVVTEDNVVGAGAGYNQSNYYDGTAGHPYYGAGNPIVGFVHGHVAREWVGGAWGVGGDIPGTVAFGNSFTHTFTYTLPAGYDEDEIHLVAFVSRYDGTGLNERKILNSEEMQLLTPAGIFNSSNSSEKMTAYPNPFSDRITFEFNLEKTSQLKMEVLDLMGRNISTLGEGIMNSGTHSLYWNGTSDNGIAVANGLYTVRLFSQEGERMSIRVNLSR